MLVNKNTTVHYLFMLVCSALTNVLKCNFYFNDLLVNVDVNFNND